MGVGHYSDVRKGLKVKQFPKIVKKKKAISGEHGTYMGPSSFLLYLWLSFNDPRLALYIVLVLYMYIEMYYG